MKKKTMTDHDIEVWKAIRYDMEQKLFKQNAPVNLPPELIYNLSWMMNLIDGLALDEIEQPILNDYMGTEC